MEKAAQLNETDKTAVAVGTIGKLLQNCALRRHATRLKNWAVQYHD
jgi:hypothetical protein